jgi:hypothetical protein
LHVGVVSGYTLVCVVGGSVVDVRALVNFVEWHFVEQEEGVVVRLFGGREQIKYVLQPNIGFLHRLRILRDKQATCIELITCFLEQGCSRARA